MFQVRRRTIEALIGFFILFGIVPQSRSASSDSHDDHLPAQGQPGPNRPQQQGGQQEQSTCSVSGQQLADFANGDNYNFHSMVTFLSQPECQDAAPALSKAAQNIGVKFTSYGPYKLQDYASSIPGSDPAAMIKVDSILSKNVSGWLRESPLSSSEILPVIGQLALLSPSASRISLVNLIETQLYNYDPGMLDPKSPEFATAAKGLAAILTKLGANEPVLAVTLADSVEEMAVLAQADSLAKIFRGLGTAATADATLAPTFNLSADAFSRGVQKGNKFYSGESRNSLLLAVFQALRVSVSGSEALEPGGGELNEAFEALAQGKPLQLTSLKKLYKEAIRVVSESTTQPALADALAISLTPEYVFLPAKYIGQLLRAGLNYPQIADSLQQNYLLAWKKLWEQLQDGESKVADFNRAKTKVFEPVLAGLLDLRPATLDPAWLGELLRRGVISDEQVEKKFPRFLLTYLEQREKSNRNAIQNIGMESMVVSMTEDFRVLWTLSSVHVPALMKWVQRYDH